MWLHECLTCSMLQTDQGALSFKPISSSLKSAAAAAFMKEVPGACSILANVKSASAVDRGGARVALRSL